MRLNYATLETLERSNETFRTLNRLQLANRNARTRMPAIRVLRIDETTFVARYGSKDIVFVHSDGSYSIKPEPNHTMLRHIADQTPATIVYKFGKFSLLFNDFAGKGAIKEFTEYVRVNNQGQPLESF